MICTFFGHRTVSEEIEPILRETIVELIQHDHADVFYVGNQGGFDFMVRKVLRELATIYPHISYFVVLAYMPGVRKEWDMLDYSDTIYPEGLEKTPKRFAISKRNRWMVEQADMVVTYVLYAGGAAQFKELAEKKGKRVINLSQKKKRDTFS